MTRWKETRSRWFLMLVLICFPVAHGFAQRIADERVHKLLVEGCDLGLKQQYDDGYARCDEIIQLQPDSPIGYLYEAAILEARSMDFETRMEEERVEPLLDKAIELSRKMLEKNDRDTWGYYFLGSAFGYYANYHVRIGNWIRGANYGYKAKKEFERCIEVDSTFYDAYLGLGTFRYWRSRKTELFNWLLFLGDDREEGIRFIKLTIEKGTYNKFQALHSLIWILIDAGRYDEAITYSKEALETYPTSRFFLWGLARAYENGNPEAAREVYQELLRSVTSEKTSNHYSEVVLHYLIGKMSFQLGEYDTALRECENVLSHNDLDEDVKGRLEERMDLTKKLMENVKQKMQEAR